MSFWDLFKTDNERLLDACDHAVKSLFSNIAVIDEDGVVQPVPLVWTIDKELDKPISPQLPALVLWSSYFSINRGKGTGLYQLAIHTKLAEQMVQILSQALFSQHSVVMDAIKVTSTVLYLAFNAGRAGSNKVAIDLMAEVSSLD